MYFSDDYKIQNKNYDLFSDDEVSKFDVQIWTDGASSHNGRDNAKAAWAFVAGKHEEAGLVSGKQTNNRAEAYAIYNGLKWASRKGYKKIKIHTDSQITIFGVSKSHEKVKENKDIFALISDVISKNNLDVTYEKVLGHSGDPNNERADRLAVSLTLRS
jgi:ribonuclease HI